MPRTINETRFRVRKAMIRRVDGNYVVEADGVTYDADGQQVRVATIRLTLTDAQQDRLDTIATGIGQLLEGTGYDTVDWHETSE